MGDEFGVFARELVEKYFGKEAVKNPALFMGKQKMQGIGDYVSKALSNPHYQNLTPAFATNGMATPELSDVVDSHIAMYSGGKGEYNSKPGFMQKAKAFTMIELLVVISVIAILAGMLLPALGGARTRAIDVRSQAQIKSLSAAILMYRNTYNADPPIWFDGSWQIHNSLKDMKVVEGTDFAKVWEDPFRQIDVRNDPVLTTPGLLFVNEGSPPGGKGHVYINFVSEVTPNNPVIPLNVFNGLYPKLGLPDDTKYIIFGVGPDGKLDMDPEKDNIWIRRESDEGIVKLE